MILSAFTVGLVLLALAALLIALAWYIAGRGSDAYLLPYWPALALMTLAAWILYIEARDPGTIPRLKLW